MPLSRYGFGVRRLPVAGGRSGGGGDDVLGLVEQLGRDERRVGGFGAVDPVGLVVPSEFGCVAEGDVVFVEEDLVSALLGPRLMPGVAGVLEHRLDGRFGPDAAGPCPVAVAFGVVCGGAGDTVFGEFSGEAGVAGAGDEVLEDALHDARGGGVGFEAVEALADACLLGVGVWSGIGQLVAVGRPSAEEAAVSGLDLHGGADSGADAVAFAFAHAAEQPHDEVVGFGVGVDASADLGDPEFDAVVDEEGEGEAELVAAEGPVGFADDDGVEASGSVGEGGEEEGGFGSALPRERARLADVEVLDDDLTANVGDQVAGDGHGGPHWGTRKLGDVWTGVVLSDNLNGHGCCC